MKGSTKYQMLKVDFDLALRDIGLRNEIINKSAILIADLMFAYMSKDDDFPHDFEIDAFEKGLYFLQEHYKDGSYSLKMFENALGKLHNKTN